MDQSSPQDKFKLGQRDHRTGILGAGAPESSGASGIVIHFMQMDSNDTLGLLTIWQDIEEKQAYSDKI